MQINTTGAQNPIVWRGGDGTISLSEITPAMGYPKFPPDVPGNPEIPTIPGNVGGFGTAVVEFEASFNSGETWKQMSKNGVVVQFTAGGIEAQNFSSSGCLIRANVVSGATTGEGIVLGINGRGQ